MVEDSIAIRSVVHAAGYCPRSAWLAAGGFWRDDRATAKGLVDHAIVDNQTVDYRRGAAAHHRVLGGVWCRGSEAPSCGGACVREVGVRIQYVVFDVCLDAAQKEWFLGELLRLLDVHVDRLVCCRIETRSDERSGPQGPVSEGSGPIVL